MTANKVLTLFFVKKCHEILLGYKKRGFGAGRWNGFGGKVELGETIQCAAMRELKEESGLTALAVNKVGILMFEFLGNPQLLEVHVFKTEEFAGEPTECDEMRPKWFSLEDIPYDIMWPDDRLWLPYMLQDKQFYGYFTFTDMNHIRDYTLKEVKDLNEVLIPHCPTEK